MDKAVEFGALKGVFHDAGLGPAFACVHGLTLNHSMFSDLAVAAGAAGISVLRFHLRGHFESGGRLEDQGFNDAVDDVVAGVEFLKKQPGVDPSRVGLLGFSIGGAESAVASKRTAVKALATWGSLFDTKRWKTERYEQYNGAVDGVVKIWDGIGVSVRLFTEAIENDPFQDALDYGGPMFLAHGGKDKNHPQEKSIELVARRKALGKLAEGYFPETSGHKFQVPADWAVLNQKTLEFFKAHL